MDHFLVGAVVHVFYGFDDLVEVIPHLNLGQPAVPFLNSLDACVLPARQDEVPE